MEAAIRQRDELNLKTSLQNVLQLDPSSARTLKLLSDLLIRTDDRKQLEEHLRRLVIVHLQGGNLREARDSLNKLVVYARKSYYLDLLNQLNDGMVHSSNGKLSEICRTVVHTLEEGGLEQEENPPLAGMALGVTDLDLGLSLGFQSDKVDSNEPAEVS
jgi:hypothetical protein